MPLVQHCATEDYNETTGECSDPYWDTEAAGFLPALTLGQANQLFYPISLLICVAWVFRRLMKQVEQD